MKSTGIVRKLDELGRIVIPREIRRTFEIEDKDGLEIFTDGNQIILKRYQPACLFCGEADDVIEFEGKKICRTCIEAITDKGQNPEVL